MKWLFPFIFLIAPASALAQQGPSAPKVSISSAANASTATIHAKLAVPTFSQADKNNDGWIEWSEAKAVGIPKSVFDQHDQQKKGKLTMTEWQVVRLEMIKTPYPLPKAATQTGSSG